MSDPAEVVASFRAAGGPSWGAAATDALVAPWYRCLAPETGDPPLFDAHTHLGCADPDGSCIQTEELLEDLASAGTQAPSAQAAGAQPVEAQAVGAQAVVFPLAEPRSYRDANDRVLASAAASRGRLIPFCRVDPHDHPLEEAARAVANGAAGIKLHPRAEHFALDHPAVGALAEFAGVNHLPLIIHAGRGISSLGRDALVLADAHPRTAIILAHLAISDLSWIWSEAPRRPNLLFDTAWWNVADQLALFSMVPPGQIVFASDAPYGRTVATAAIALRAALAARLSARQIEMVAGGQLARLLSGQEPLELGPAPQANVAGPGPLLERIHSLLVAASARLSAGYPAEEYLELARLACELPATHPDATAAASVRELLDRHAALIAAGPPRIGPRVPGVHLVFVAAAVARLPGQPLPAVGAESTGGV